MNELNKIYEINEQNMLETLKMKIRNFKRAFNYVLLNVPDSEFSMNGYRKNDRSGYITEETTLKCNTVGCIIGHCTNLVKAKNFYRFEYFLDWSRYFFGMKAKDGRVWCRARRRRVRRRVR